MANVGSLLMDRYRLDALVGRGAMSTVFRAWDTRLHRRVAVKVLASNLAAEPDVARRFEAEARHLGAVTHPNLVTVFDVGDEHSEPFYVMELVEGETLERRLLRLGMLSPTETAAIVAQVAKALDLMHARGLVHRDVKPGNVLLSDGSSARLADFGLVRDDRTGETTVLGELAGTLGYMAPEVIRGEPATAASDVYALGVLAYRALTGSLPYPVGTIAELLEAQAVEARPASALRPDLGEGMDAALASALGPAEARPTASELAAHINLALATMDPAALWVPASPASPAPSGAPRSRSEPASRASMPTGAVSAGVGGAQDATVRVPVPVDSATVSPSVRTADTEPTRRIGMEPGTPRRGPHAHLGFWSLPSSLLVAAAAILLLGAFALAGFWLPGFLVLPQTPNSGNPALLAPNASSPASPEPSLAERAHPGASLRPVPSSSPLPTTAPTPSVNPPSIVRPAPTLRHHPVHHRQHRHHHRHRHGHHERHHD